MMVGGTMPSVESMCSEPDGLQSAGNATWEDIMRKLLMTAGLCALFATPALAGEPAKLTSAQMDKVTAGRVCVVCLNIAVINQVNLNLGSDSWVKQINNARVRQSTN
jgi:hypothetical protein